MKKYPALLLALLLFVIPVAKAAGDGNNWPQGSLRLLDLAKKDESYAAAEQLHPAYYPTSDGRSFILVWMPQQTMPKKWIVSLPGTHGLATRDLTVWYRHIKDRDVGLISVQWWLGQGDTTRDYYSPFDIYREVDTLLSGLGIQPGTALLEGFSRGSANIYAVAALDRNKGRQYFSMFVAHAGGASLDYPPTHAIDTGTFGVTPFTGSTWVTVCGGKDPNPDRDGCPAMRNTGLWLTKMGGTVALAIEDDAEGHGALHRNPANAKKLLDLFLGQP